MAFIWRRVQAAGGVRQSFWKLLKMRDLRAGTLVGTDSFGNEYFENKDHIYGRHRWVLYARKDFDASQVTPEWHRWLHHMGEHNPIAEPLEIRKFQLEHSENLSGTVREYVPYSTTRPKIESWQPPTAA
ncbi:NADH dehydrogenase [ubiquinone] 1 alpha subcomplex subunit 12-like [Halichondria panicea]|uniref:NADH dehydrogenase [ubiquinone] 1 alpha subcomplex subunit 12-like n=1 Tax=Halichondria panicea TaxID=6063 RepID=UPI00312B9971